ncbi:hypothetical protein K1T71_002919 [Dendrolimus kikuchii]|uniref:Uncharacterized protein n=1 Tax=Dendrolimus kikuchii TaxID=765133 RepID=A0ACC1DAP5_9NEOP|nr:hypothetical protein K1T71_002919 [Dendrolimus kikuchii]
MSRIRGIEVRVQKEVLQTRKYGLNEILKSKTEEPSDTKEDVEKQQISELLHKLPKLDKIFEVHRKIGEGTFSSVYLGSLRQHTALPASEKRWFAIKHLVPTAHPARIEHELRCLQDIGGRNNVIGVDLCLRHMDTIVFIMPYIPHKKFSEYVGDMDAGELRRYMRALLVALRHVHSFGVIHRDVKPSNFLYDRENGRYLLVDFGLAQRICPPEEGSKPPPPPAHCNNPKRPRDEQEDCMPSAKRMALDLSLGTKKNGNAVESAKLTPQSPKATFAPRINMPKENGAAGRCGCGGGAGCARCRCACAGAGAVCGWCAGRGAARAPRAGTQGFRPPEVLLKVPEQTTAVDMWACGVVLASALSARYPFFRAADDLAALAELADLLGTTRLRAAAEALGRRVVTSAQRRGVCLRRLCARLRRAHARAPHPAPAHAHAACEQCTLPPTQCLCRDETKKPEDFDSTLTIAGFPDSAFSLAARLLDPNPHTRISADEALRHPFLEEDD